MSDRRLQRRAHRRGRRRGGRRCASAVTSRCCTARSPRISATTGRGRSRPPRATSPRAARSRGSSAAGPAPAPRSRPTRSAACAPRRYGDAATADGARRWNDANVLARSLRTTSEAVLADILDAWFARHRARAECPWAIERQPPARRPRRADRGERTSRAAAGSGRASTSASASASPSPSEEPVDVRHPGAPPLGAGAPWRARCVGRRRPARVRGQRPLRLPGELRVRLRGGVSVRPRPADRAAARARRASRGGRTAVRHATGWATGPAPSWARSAGSLGVWGAVTDGRDDAARRRHRRSSCTARMTRSRCSPVSPLLFAGRVTLRDLGHGGARARVRGVRAGPRGRRRRPRVGPRRAL